MSNDAFWLGYILLLSSFTQFGKLCSSLFILKTIVHSENYFALKEVIIHCLSLHKLEHILFQSKNVKNIRRILWQKVIEKISIPMIEEFNSRTTREKVIYIFTAVYMGNP